LLVNTIIIDIAPIQTKIFIKILCFFILSLTQPRIMLKTSPKNIPAEIQFGPIVLFIFYANNTMPRDWITTSICPQKKQKDSIDSI